VLTVDPSKLVIVLLAGLLGTIGLYLVLPHRTGQGKPTRSHAVGAVLSIAALLLLGSFWVGPELLINKFFFLSFGALSIVGGVLMISSRDPIYSALWFAVVVLSSSGLFLLAGAQFLAAGTVIVYAGAIVVTFLFVIMLAQSHGRAAYDRMSRAPLLAALSTMVLLVGLVSSILASRTQISAAGPIERRVVPASQLAALSNASPTTGLRRVLDRAVPSTARLPVDADGRQPEHVAGLGATLFVDHLVTVELVGVILFIALIGACSYAAQRVAGRPRDALADEPAPSAP
jgi:NADH-quinone oxidoreductase subunit J